MFKEDFNKVTSELEDILQKIAGDIASGIIFEKLSPSELLNKTEHYVEILKDLATKSEELSVILKPEKAHSARTICKNFTQTLTTFKEILLQNSPEPLANSRLAFEQLRKALTDGSDLLFLMRDIRDNPSPLMDKLLTLKKASETKSSVISIQTSEEIQPLIKYVLSRIDKFRAALIGLEKKVDEMKQIMRELQEDSLKTLTIKASSWSETAKNKNQESQLSLSNFENRKSKNAS